MYAEAAATADEDTRKTLGKHALKCEAAGRIAAMLELANSEPGIPVLPDQLDANPWTLNVLNGAVDLRTGQLWPHRRQDSAYQSWRPWFTILTPCVRPGTAFYSR